MYNPHPGTVAGTTGTLAATGTGSLWLALAAFTLTGAGFALLRLLPRLGR